MGRWSYSSRRMVKECKSISVKWLKDNGYLYGGRSGGMKWTNSSGEDRGSIGFDVSTLDGYIDFHYTYTNRKTGEKEDLTYRVSLVNTPCNFGDGVRWWFICPLDINGRDCDRRVGVLYLGGKYFGCRYCYNLTYESCKESHTKIGFIRKLTRKALKADPEKGKSTPLH